MSNASEQLASGTPARPIFSDVASHAARALFSLRESLMRGEFAPGWLGVVDGGGQVGCGERRDADRRLQQQFLLGVV